MSAKATAWAWHVAGISCTEKVVLVRLADHANDQGVCWPGKDNLADACCMSRRAVDAVILRLEAAKLISITRRATESGRNKSNVYQLHMDQGDLFKDAPAASPQEVRGRSKQQRTPQEVREDPAAAAPESSIEPKEEPLDLSSSADEVQKKAVYETKKGKKLTGGQLSRFDRFWETFGYKSGKAEAGDAWLEAVEPRLGNRLVTVEHILAAAAAENQNRAKVREAGQVPKMAQGWLAARRWEDFEPPAGSRQAEPVPWYHTWSGITEEAGNRGIMNRDYPEPPDLVLALIQKMQAAQETVPEGLRDYHKHLLRETQRKTA